MILHTVCRDKDEPAGGGMWSSSRVGLRSEKDRWEDPCPDQGATNWSWAAEGWKGSGSRRLRGNTWKWREAGAGRRSGVAAQRDSAAVTSFLTPRPASQAGPYECALCNVFTQGSHTHTGHTSPAKCRFLLLGFLNIWPPRLVFLSHDYPANVVHAWFLGEPPHFSFHLENIAFPPMTHPGRVLTTSCFVYKILLLYSNILFKKKGKSEKHCTSLDMLHNISTRHIW